MLLHINYYLLEGLLSDMVPKEYEIWYSGYFFNQGWEMRMYIISARVGVPLLQ